MSETGCIIRIILGFVITFSGICILIGKPKTAQTILGIVFVFGGTLVVASVMFGLHEAKQSIYTSEK